VQRFLTSRHDSLGGRSSKVDQVIVSNADSFSGCLLLSLSLPLFFKLFFLHFPVSLYPRGVGAIQRY
jgi:hypothetical protein